MVFIELVIIISSISWIWFPLVLTGHFLLRNRTAIRVSLLRHRTPIGVSLLRNGASIRISFYILFICPHIFPCCIWWLSVFGCFDILLNGFLGCIIFVLSILILIRWLLIWSLLSFFLLIRKICFFRNI